jgi:hypothetical protein
MSQKSRCRDIIFSIDFCLNLEVNFFLINSCLANPFTKLSRVSLILTKNFNLLPPFFNPNFAFDYKMNFNEKM